MNTYKTLFFIRREKQNPDTHKCPIYLLITLDTRTELSLNLEVDLPAGIIASRGSKEALLGQNP
jgi:hypothetical protein